jgi:hypothetical protein
MVIPLTADTVDAFCAEFLPPEFYCSTSAAHEAVRRRHQFNIIHSASGLKVDVIVPDDTEFNRSRLSRGMLIPGEGFSATFASPEDVILKKLEYFQKGGSEKHLRDIAGVLKIRAGRIDFNYIESWIRKLKLTVEWDRVPGREWRGSDA